MTEQVILSYHLQRQCGNVRPHSTKCGNTWAVDDIENWACETQPPAVICSKASLPSAPILECPDVADRPMPKHVLVMISDFVGGCSPMISDAVALFPTDEVTSDYPLPGTAELRYVSPWEVRRISQCASGPYTVPYDFVRWRLSIGCETSVLALDYHIASTDPPNGSYGVAIFSTPADGVFHSVSITTGTFSGFPFCGYGGLLLPDTDCFAEVINASVPPIGSCTVTLSTPDDAFEE